MDPPPVDDSVRRVRGKGGNARSRLGLKRTSAASPRPGSSTASPGVPPPSPYFAPDAPTATPATTTPTPTSTAPATTVPNSFPVPPWPPNFASPHGNPQSPNSWLHPSSGFLNFAQQPYYPPHAQGQNFHLVGQTTTVNHISPPAHSANGVATPPTTNKTVNIEIDEDDNNDANRPPTKKHWTHEEEERLASAWLNASKDPIRGNDKKGDTFWKEVTDEYNKKGIGKRRREINQLKVHWSRLKSSINDFNGYWTKVTQMHTSGYSNDMLEDKAQKMYENKFGKRFSLVHWWRKLKDEPKWRAQFEEAEKNKSEIVDVDDEESRPIGRDAARAEHSGKRKKENIMEGIIILGEKIDEVVKVHRDRNLEREKTTAAQIKISDTNLKAAEEHKKAKMFEVYNSLLNQNTSEMSESQKANRDKAICKLEEKLFGD